MASLLNMCSSESRGERGEYFQHVSTDKVFLSFIYKEPIHTSKKKINVQTGKKMGMDLNRILIKEM